MFLFFGELETCSLFLRAKKQQQKIMKKDRIA